MAILYKQDGSKIGEIELSEKVFGLNSEEYQQAVFNTVIAERAAMRQGTQKAKTRHEVSGGGKKPWRQKGTGRARQGSIRAPQWRGGGIVFAPTPRSHAIKVNKKVVRLAMRCALSDKVKENEMFVVDALSFDTCKTKNMVSVLKAFDSDYKKVIVVLDDVNANVELAGRNIPNCQVSLRNHVSVFEMMNADALIITEAAVKQYEEVLK